LARPHPPFQLFDHDLPGKGFSLFPKKTLRVLARTQLSIITYPLETPLQIFKERMTWS
jgi:hypothetical protein